VLATVTGFAIPEFKWIFDCGARIQGWTLHRIFLSHTHSDHVHYLTHQKNSSHPPIVHLPHKAVPLVQAFLRAHRELNDCTTLSGLTFNEDLRLEAMLPVQEFVIRQGGHEFVCRTVECDDRIDCIGFSIVKRKKRLKDEYFGRSGLEIGQLRKQGIKVTTFDEEPFVCFLGDNTQVVFERYPTMLFQHTVVVLECSFIDEASLERARETKHMHWLLLQPHVEAHPKTLFVLIHFILKYKSLELRQFFSRKLSLQEYSPNAHRRRSDTGMDKVWANGPAPTCNCFQCCPC